MNEITKELKLGCENCQRDCEIPCWKLDHFGAKAADMIESLQAEVKEWRDAYIRMKEQWKHDCELLVQSGEKLAESQRRGQAAVRDLTNLAQRIDENEACRICAYNVEWEGCKLDGSQFNDDGDCHFEWCGPQVDREDD